jgi:uncharacterized LabA/DUF88 family protein
MEEERIALFLDYENLAIGAREELDGGEFDLKPVADALAERGRVVVRRAYADWSFFEEDRRRLTRHHVELIEIPQRMGAGRKNAADIKMTVDALELAFERDYLTTFVIGTGDSDFTPLVHKLRELNRRVIGVGIKSSTSALLPPACDEFLFYESLEGVDLARPARRRRRQREQPQEVLASSLKRALLRKDPTFSEADYGFRAFGELLRHLEEQKVIELSDGIAKGDPEVGFPEERSGEDDAFALLQSAVLGLEAAGAPPYLSGLKNELRKRQPDFSEKPLGFRGFLQFVKAGQARGLVHLEWDESAGDYRVTSIA